MSNIAGVFGFGTGKKIGVLFLDNLLIAVIFIRWRKFYQPVPIKDQVLFLGLLYVRRLAP